MKRLISILFAIVIAMTSVVPAFADSAGPPISSYKVYVSNPDGACTYDDKGREDSKTSVIIPYGTELTVHGYFLEGEEYVSTRYNGESHYIKMKDVSFNNIVIGIEDTQKLPYKEKLIVVNKDGATLYNGPSHSYDMVSEKIPYGTEFEYEYVELGEYSSWAYVTVNGISGWIYTYENDVAKVLNERSGFSGKVIVISKGAEMTETLEEDSKKLDINIPVGTELAFQYYQYTDNYKVYVEYNGQKGWLRASGRGWREEPEAVLMGVKGGVYILDDKLPVYDKPLVDNSAKKVGEVKGDVSIAVDYVYYTVVTQNLSDDSYDTCRININGKNYWISGKDGKISYADSVTEYTIMEENGAQMFAEPSEKSKKLSDIPKGVTVKSSYREYDGHKWVFAEYNGEYGWIRAYGESFNTEGTENFYEILMESKPDFVKEKPVTTTKKVTTTKNVPTTKKPTSTAETKNKATTKASATTQATTQAPVVSTTIAPPAELTTAPTTAVTATEKVAVSASPKTIIIACVAGAAVIAVTAAVTITLVNKKKKEQ